MSELERIGENLDRVLRRLGLPAADAVQRLTAEWAELAGEPWASRARPAGLHRGELVVEVPDGTTASLLRYKCQDLLDRLEKGLGARFADSVRIRLANPKKSL
jgi:predicted nucleic acid-binding Zn ribbon protein